MPHAIRSDLLSSVYLFGEIGWVEALGVLSLLGALMWLCSHRLTKLLQEKRSLEQQIAERITELQRQAQHLQAENQELRACLEIGHRILSANRFEVCVAILYEHLRKLMDTDAFGIGIYNSEREEITYQDFIDMGVRLPALTVTMSDKDRPAVWCIRHRKDILIGDFEKEYRAYIEQLPKPRAAGQPKSLLFSPILVGERVMGVLTVQSYKPNAYTPQNLEQLKRLNLCAALAIERCGLKQEPSPAVAALLGQSKEA
ncbi:MAG: GAF domain-containing protein [Chloroherpetonaceae bacterium]|nr:GAF domain-containing protein [Chloroherpetonaceae bacterium]MDW8020716.1 GAF domain-containing protein [Chloroherpetonaceae bacterium]